MRSADSRGGPLATDRPTAENLGKKFTTHGTRVTRQRTPGRTEPANSRAQGHLVVSTRGHNVHGHDATEVCLPRDHRAWPRCGGVKPRWQVPPFQSHRVLQSCGGAA